MLIFERCKLVSRCKYTKNLVLYKHYRIYFMEDTKKLVSERFNLLLESLKLSVPDLARNLNYERSDKLYNISKGKYLPSFEIMSDITKKFVSFNANWLLTGEGSMFRDVQEQPESQPSAQDTQSDSSSGEAAVYYKMYKEEKAEKEAKIEEIGALKLQLRQFKEKASKEHPKGLGSPETVKPADTPKHYPSSDHSADSANFQIENP